MKKELHYCYVKFSPEVIQKAWATIEPHISKEDRKHLSLQLTVKFPSEEWDHDSEAEFYADYRKDAKHASHYKSVGYGKYIIRIWYARPCTDVSITAPSRAIIEEVHEIFQSAAKSCALPRDTSPSEKDPVIFIGHGNSPQWRDLKDHLHEKHGYAIEAYEIGARAGHTIRDILQDMLKKSSYAILVMTGEDIDASGKAHPRDNVIHELGLFQGKLGFTRAIVLLEDGTEEFSNIHGIHQVRYSKANIKETYGEVLATLRSEFAKDA